MEIVILNITSDMSLNYFFSIFFYLTVVLAPLFGAVALITKS